MNYEYEAKALINIDDYNKLLSQYEINSSIYQVNTYFETKDNWFREHKSALRIRKIGSNPAILTLKIQIEDGNEEYDYELSQNQYTKLMDNLIPPNFTFPITIPKLDQKVVISTTRKVFTYLKHNIELDESNFNGTTDYEIEIEANSISIANDIMDTLAQENKITINSSCPKIARYFKYNK